MMDVKTNSESIISRVNSVISNENVLGVQVYWTLHSKHEGKLKLVDIDEFKSALEANGFLRGDLRPQSNKSKFLEVVDEVAKKSGLEAKRISVKDGRVVIKFVKAVARLEDNICDSRFVFKQDTTVVFDSKMGFAIEGEGDVEIIDAVKSGYDYHLDKTSVNFIRSTFIDLLREHMSVKLRDTGGIYFVPFKYSNVVDGIHNLTRDFDLGKITTIRMPAGPAEIEGIKDSVCSELKQRLKHYNDHIEKVSKISTLEGLLKSDLKKESARLAGIYGEVLAASVDVSEHQAKEDAVFEEIRNGFMELEMVIANKIVSLERKL